MTGRERLLNLLEGRPVDRLVWTTLVDDTTRSVMPPAIRDMPVLDFYRHIGCDFAAFGNYGLPPELRVISPCRLARPGVEARSEQAPDGTVTRTTRSPWGELVAVSRRGHPIKHAVETPADLATLTAIWAHARYEEIGAESEDSVRRLDAAIGDSGLFSFTFEPTPMQQVLEIDMGLVNAYALHADHPAEFAELLEVMQACRRQEYEICARRVDCRAFIAVENTSTTLISPALYERHSLAHVRDFVDIMHRHGRLAILHMCGLLRDLLPLIRATGADGVNALTPPPIGNTPFADTLDALGERALIWGGLLPDTVFHAPSFSRAALEEELARTYSPRLRAARFLLWLPADGLATPVERFLMVREWMERNGRLA